MEGHRDEEEDGTQPYKKRSGERRREGRSAGQPSQFRPSFHLPSLPPCPLLPPPLFPSTHFLLLLPFLPLLPALGREWGRETWKREEEKRRNGKGGRRYSHAAHGETRRRSEIRS